MAAVSETAVSTTFLFKCRAEIQLVEILENAADSMEERVNVLLLQILHDHVDAVAEVLLVLSRVTVASVHQEVECSPHASEHASA